MVEISAAEQQRRREMIGSVYGTHAMESMFPDAATEAILSRWVAGELSDSEREVAMRAHAQELLTALGVCTQGVLLVGAA